MKSHHWVLLTLFASWLKIATCRQSVMPMVVGRVMCLPTGKGAPTGFPEVMLGLAHIIMKGVQHVSDR